jgi:hypothetical protein
MIPSRLLALDDNARFYTESCLSRLRAMYFIDFENGEGGIRTPVRLPLNRFRVCRIQPLCHLSKV